MQGNIVIWKDGSWQYRGKGQATAEFETDKEYLTTIDLGLLTEGLEDPQ